MGESPRLSIVIATKDRQEYCFETVRTLLGVINDETEIVIHDNSNSDDLKRLLSEVNDLRIVYRFNEAGEPISFVENFNRAVGLSSGKFVCAIGDDDAVLPVIYDLLDWMDNDKVESLTQKQNTDYTWPDSTNPESSGGRLFIPEYTGTRVEVDVNDKLIALLKNGLVDYQKFGLPRVYHGIVSRDLLERAKQIAGHYFGGLTQDIYSTVALSLVSQKHYVIDQPFTIAGACPKSFSAASIKGGHSGKLADAPHLEHRGDYKWEQKIPAFYSVETIWAESGLKALKDMQREDLVAYCNYYKLYAEAFIRNRRFVPGLSFKMIYKTKKYIGKGSATHLLLVAEQLFHSLLSRILSRRKSDSVHEIKNVPDLNAAIIKTMQIQK